MNKTTAIIVAAGASSRIGLDKLFIEIFGKPVLLYSLEAFQNARNVHEIVVVANTENIHKARKLCKEHDLPKVKCVVLGGSTRVQSVQNGLDAIPDTEGIVAIHDGARPLVTPGLIDKVVYGANTDNAAIPAVRVKDTIKQIKKWYVEFTPERECLYAAQTPQAFDLYIYRQAIRVFPDVTDDSTSVEGLGVKVKVIEGDYRNIKITTPEDLLLVEALIRNSEW